MKIWTYAHIKNGKIDRLETWRVKGNSEIYLDLVRANHLNGNTIVFIGACLDFPLRRAAYYDDPDEWYNETKPCNIPFEMD